MCRAGGPLRCWPGGLAVCRAIGDADCGAAICAVPAVHTVTCDTTASGGALIICSDGVWDALTQDKVAKYTRDCATASEAAERVVDKATKARGLRDDITAAVAWLGNPPWLNKPNAGRRLLRRLSGSNSRDSGSESDLSPFPSPSPSPSPSPLSRRFGRGRASFEHCQSPASSPSTPSVLSPFCLQPSDAPSSPSELQIPPSQGPPSRVAPDAELNPSPGARRRMLPEAFARTLPDSLERLHLRPPG